MSLLKGGNALTQEKIARINELYHKSQSQGLTDAEKIEQQGLRTEYRKSILNNMKCQLGDPADYKKK